MPETRKVFHDSVVPIPVATGPAAHGLVVNAALADDKAKPLTLHFSLALPADQQAELETAVAEGRTVPAAQLAGYGAKAADAAGLKKWLQDNGFHIESESADHTSVYASAPASTIEKSLDVDMVQVNRGGLTYTAARNAPSLPDSVGTAVQAIAGLQPFRQAHKSLVRAPNVTRLPTVADSGTAPGTTAARVPNEPPYVPAEIMAAYDAQGLSGGGAGQTIAILIDTFPNDADLTAFWRFCGLPTTLSQVTKINVSGGALPATSGEETLDAQWTSGIAPGADIRIYASGSLSLVDLDRAMDQIIEDVATTPGLRQLSISMGLGETYYGGPTGEIAIQHQKFLKLAAAGVNVFVSTGDAGSNPDGTGHSSTGPLQAEYQSTDPCVVAVGGTTLNLKSDGTIASEVGWSGSGGGKSIYFPRPRWQLEHAVTGAQRLVPDVSAPADPQTGGLIVFNGQGQGVGGTSWSAPIWAGFCALLNSARVQAGGEPLPFLNPILYTLRSSHFRDVKSGSNGQYHGQRGYDLVTGLGVPHMSKLAKTLVVPAPPVHD